ncbi:MAG: peptide transporter, partial [Pseudonocardiales bacterium]|nr:peptide transporter [Pseudonocardiales bacterium]
MLQYSLRRIVATVPALIGIVIVVFSILRLLPGDPAAFILGENAGGPQLLVMRHRLGLDRPLLDQFGTYLNGLAHFDLGTSLTTSLSVTSLIGHALGYTAVLAFAALIIGIVVAVPLGVVAAAAKFRGRERTDGAIMSVVMVLNNVPSFYLSLLLIMLFTDYLNILPLSGSIEWTDPGGLFLRMVMPVIALAIGTVVTLTRVVRAS